MEAPHDDPEDRIEAFKGRIYRKVYAKGRTMNGRGVLRYARAVGAIPCGRPF